MSDTSLARNKATVERFYEGFNNGDHAVFDEILAPDWVDHPSAPWQEAGPAGLKSVVAAFRSAFRGLVITPQVVVAERDHVVARIKLAGAHVGDWAGYRATGKAVTFDGMDMFRLRDGRIAETWHFEDYGSLGAIDR